jgi:hypothetical protein
MGNAFIGFDQPVERRGEALTPDRGDPARVRTNGDGLAARSVFERTGFAVVIRFSTIPVEVDALK